MKDEYEEPPVEYDETFSATEFGNYYGDSFDGWYDEQPHDAWWQSSQWEGEQPDEVVQESSEPDETLAHLLKEKEEAERSHTEMQALMADNTRNLMEARRAAAQAAKDRGWNQPLQQRQPRSTSHYFQKGSKGGKFSGQKGKINYQEEAAWMKGKGQGSSKGYNNQKGFSGAKGYPNYKSKGPSVKGFCKDANYMTGYHFYPIDDGFQFEETYVGNDETVGASESIVDTGATATAGGQDAVESLYRAVMTGFPDATMELFASDRPWFRYGNGKWGKALFKVVLSRGSTHVPIYSLPSPVSQSSPAWVS